MTNLNSTIILICGLSGSGKDTFAKLLACNEDVKRGLPAIRIVTSYTTRPMRVGETQGKEHMFVDEGPGGRSDLANELMNDNSIHRLFDDSIIRRTVVETKTYPPIMAWCQYGGYEYWTYVCQFKPLPYSIYIVDEASLVELKRKSERYQTRRQVTDFHGWKRDWAFKVKTVLVTRDNIDVDAERTKRDKSRNLSHIKYDVVINNNGTIDDLAKQATRLRKQIFAENKE